MERIESSFDQFKQALDEGKPLLLRRGESACYNLLRRLVVWICSSGIAPESRLVLWARERFSQDNEDNAYYWKCESSLFDRAIGLITGENSRLRELAEGISELIDRNGEEKWISVAEKVSALLSEKGLSSHNLEWRLAALKARYHPVQAGVDISPVLEAATKWREENPLYVLEKGLHPEEERLLSVLEKYQDFAQLLLRDSSLRESFFKWSILNCNDPELFINHAQTATLIHQSLLSGRIGAAAYMDPIQYDMEGNPTLSVLGERYSLNDLDQNVKIADDCHVPLGAIIQDFAEKNLSHGNFELIGGIVYNFSASELAYTFPVYEKDPLTGKYRLLSCEQRLIDVTQEDWWWELPQGELLTPRQVMERYELDELEEGEWIISFSASTQSGKKKINDCHAYVELLIPHENGDYFSFPFGMLAKYFPSSSLEKGLLLTKAVEARWCYDISNSYGFRGHASYPERVDETLGRDYMKRMAARIERGRKGDKNFMMSSDNCGYPLHKDWLWLNKKLGREKFPNLYMVSILETRGICLLDAMSAFVRLCPERFHADLVKASSWILGGTRKREYRGKKGQPKMKCALTSRLNRGHIHPEEKKPVLGHIPLPGLLFWKIRCGELNKGVVRYGHSVRQLRGPALKPPAALLHNLSPGKAAQSDKPLAGGAEAASWSGDDIEVVEEPIKEAPRTAPLLMGDPKKWTVDTSVTVEA